MSKLVNLTFITGAIPHEIQIAKVTPIFKSGKKDQMSNYRPISVLSVLVTSNLLYNGQYGFRRSSEIESAVFVVISQFQLGCRQKMWNSVAWP